LSFYLERQLGDVFAGERAVEPLFELVLQCNDADERVFGACIADFAPVLLI
jgi:hypothetical protein